MISRRAAVATVALLVLSLGTSGAWAGGFDLGCEIVTLDVAGTLSRVPAALEGGADRLLEALADQGLPPSELVEIESQFDLAIADASTAAAALPTLLPLPLLGGGVEIGLPLLVVDGIRLSGGFLDSALVRAIAGASGVPIPDPLIEAEFDLGGEAAELGLDVEFSVWTASVDAVKRFDLLLAALDLSAGLAYTSGAVTVDAARDVPAGWGDGVDAALAELHLDQLRWSTLAARVGARIELGVPFLRLYAEVHFGEPIVEWVGWWDLRGGGWSGSVGVVIRF